MKTKSRNIQDCLAWCFEYLHIYHQSKKEIIILKLDFEKAFDKVVHQAMLQIMRHNQFGEMWLKQMQSIFSFGTSAILLNWVPRKTFHCRRGVRQGDPLSPILFVLATNLLQSMVNSARQQGLLSLHIALTSIQDFPILQYADDTLIIMEGCNQQLVVLIDILHNFAESTGLQVNFSKSMMVPINITDERLQVLASTIGCSTGSLPFTYLGLPLGLTKPKVEEFQPLVSRYERRLVSTSQFLSEAGRLALTNSVFTAFPTFFMCTFSLHGQVIKKVDKFRKHCLWRVADLNAKKPQKATWPLVSKPKSKGLRMMHC